MQNSQIDLVWPRKAVVTAGMPYGNKPLHFGHIGGVFIPADVFARFLRDRIGKENVRFVSGTDCFGSPIDEGYRKAKESGFAGTIADYVMQNHNDQAEVLKAFDVSLDIFEGSGIGHAGEIHQMLSDAFVTGLYDQKCLKLDETMQFFDAEANMFLNGRQVQGRCPIQGCKSEHAYADECDLGHQYAPDTLINPISTVTGTVPEMRPVQNWYFDLPAFSDFLKSHVEALKHDEEVRSIVPQTVEEFLVPPVIYVKVECREAYDAIVGELPPHTYRDPQGGKQSFELEFESIYDRDVAKSMLEKASIRFRTSKALVPFRITGSIEWGVKAPELDGVSGLTIWCWPESLWAPISFTIAVNDAWALPRNTWREFWCADDSQVYQFIGQDNLYFYGVAQVALWEALGNRGIFGGEDAKKLKQTELIANHHLLFGKTKASSSGSIKPPTGKDLLEHYTAEQLRAHFIALGLDQKSVGFKPKPFDPSLSEEDKQDPRIADPVLKEGVLLTNVFNRLARSCLYESARHYGCAMPVGKVSRAVVNIAQSALQDYEVFMHRVELHSIMQHVDTFIRYANKYWTSEIKALSDALKDAGFEDINDEGVPAQITDKHKQVLIDAYYLLRVCTLMMHPIVPRGCETICSYLDFDESDFFSWNYDFESNEELCCASEIDDGMHMVRELPAKFDFFKKHPSQYT